MLNIYDYIELAEAVANEIAALPVVEQYKELQRHIAVDPQLKDLVRAFERAKEHQEESRRFGDYYPDKEKVRTDLIQTKTALFENASVKAFKKCEKEIQMILDDLSRSMEDVVEFDTGKKSGGCGSSCGCS